MCIWPFAYGGPSCKINFSLPLEFFLNLSKILSFSHFFKISGSLVGKLAFIEKAVLGNCKVSFDIFIFLLVLYQVLFVFLNIQNF